MGADVSPALWRNTCSWHSKAGLWEFDEGDDDDGDDDGGDDDDGGEGVDDEFGFHHENEDGGDVQKGKVSWKSTIPTPLTSKYKEKRGQHISIYQTS